MTPSLTATQWSKDYPSGIKQVIATHEQGIDLVATRQQYANQQGLTILAGYPDDRVALYWDKDQRLVRLAIECVSESHKILNFSDHV